MLGLTPIEVFNTDADDAPPFAILEVVAFDPENGWVEVRQPGGNDLQLVLVNCGNTLRAGHPGTAFSPFERPPYLIMYDTADTPAAGDDWGTATGQWYLVKDNEGFIAYDVTDPDKLHTDTWAFQLKVCSDS